MVELEADKVNVEVPSPSNNLGNINVKEGETVNVGTLLGTITNNLKMEISSPKEIKNYSPPKKKDTPKNPKLFEEEKKDSPSKKIIKRNAEPVLKLNNESIDEEPLILEQVFHQKKNCKKNNSLTKRGNYNFTSS